MAIARSTYETREYVLRQDRELPKEQQTTWVLGTLTAGQMAEVRDKLGGSHLDGARIAVGSPGSAMILMVAFGLREVRNLSDGQGGQVELRFSGKGPTRRVVSASLDQIAPFVDELYYELQRFNGIEDDDLGNSDSSPSSLPATQTSDGSATETSASASEPSSRSAAPAGESPAPPAPSPAGAAAGRG